MKHLKKGRKFSRIKKQRKALLKMMLGDLIVKGKISTTEAKAKELKMTAEKTISRMKKIFASGEGKEIKTAKDINPKLPKNVKPDEIKNLVERFAEKKGGYLRIIKKGQRRSDGATLAVVEFIGEDAK